VTFERTERNLGAILALLTFAAALTPSAASAQIKGSAPADEYFGRLKLSYLGINNTFRDAAISAGQHTTDSGIANKVDFAMDALNAWQSKYPRDPQLARSYFLGQLVLKKIWIKKYQDKAWAYMQHIVTTYPQTYFGKTVKADLAKGFTQHYFAEPVACGSETTAPAAINAGKYKIAIETPPCIPASPSPSPSPTFVMHASRYVL
jgi:hypothetical protein